MPKLQKSMTASGNAKNISELKKLWNSITFVAASAESGVVDYFENPDAINTKVTLGENAKKPLELDTPILIAAMSTGALSSNAKIALAKASTKVGIAHNTGEGGILPEERKHAKILIAQYSTGRFGWPKRKDYKNEADFDKANSKHIKGCAAIEIKFGQGAKPGQGGLLMADKVTPLISQLRGIPEGKNCHSPASHPDIKNSTDLKAKVDWLRKISGGLPIIVKFGAGHIEKDLNFAIRGGADIIAIDGSQGGTGAAPDVMLNEVGIDTLSALMRARVYMNKQDKLGKNLPDVIYGGGITSGADIAKAIALGAKAVFMGIPFMRVMGCVGEKCNQCWKGKCPKGIATQEPDKISNFSEKEAVEGVCTFVEDCTKEIKMLAAACGYDDVSLLNKKIDLRCLPTPYGEIANKITSIPMSYESE